MSERCRYLSMADSKRLGHPLHVMSTSPQGDGGAQHNRHGLACAAEWESGGGASRRTLGRIAAIRPAVVSVYQLVGDYYLSSPTQATLDACAVRPKRSRVERAGKC